MNSQSKLALFAAALLCLTPGVGIGHGNVAQMACTGNFKNCQAGDQKAEGGKTAVTVGAGLNAVGDKAAYNIKNVKATASFGKVSSAMTKMLAMPNPNSDLTNSVKMYTFTPTQGSRLIKDKEQRLLFVAFDLTQNLPAWTPAYVKAELNKITAADKNAKSAVYVYHHVAGEPATQWTELGKAVFTTSNLSSLGKIKFTITPEAKVNMQSGKEINIDGDLSAVR